MSLHSSLSKRYRMRFILFILSAVIFTGNIYSQTPDTSKGTVNEVKFFPDDFSELDEVPLPKITKDEKVLKTLEIARQKYLQALILLDRKDTANSLNYFEESLKTLNSLVNYPDIDKNTDFTELVKKVVEDYENSITDLNKISETSSLFIIRDKYLNEIDEPQISHQPKFESIKVIKKDTIQSTGIFKSENIIPLDDNEYVQKSIDFLTQNKIGKKFIRNCIERYGKWGPLVNDIINEEGMPPEIIFLSMVESGLNPQAVSRAKAVGMWQFIRQTGKDYGLNSKNSSWLDERKDPEKSTRASMRHLRDLYNTFNDWYLAMAAYNYGTGGVRKSIAKSRLDQPNFWELRDYLPKETRNYVPLFIATAKVAMNPKEYGIDISEFNIQEEFRFDTYTITEPISLKALSKCANISIDEFKELNPELVLSCTPPDIKNYTVRIPEGSKSSFIATLATLTPEEKQPWITHITQKRETFESIARIYQITPSELASANNMVLTKKRLKRGLSLKVPIESIVQDNDQISRTRQSKSVNETSSDRRQNDYITHQVTDGEKLSAIANQYGVKIDDIKYLNSIPYDTTTLETGRILKIVSKTFQQSKSQFQSSKRPDIIRHTVKENETIETIAEHYSVSTEDIRRWNKCNNSIHLGQNLKIITFSPYKTVDYKPIQNRNSSINNTSANVNQLKKTNETQFAEKRLKHKVKRGENLSSIADNYGVSEDDIKEWNPRKIKGSKILSGSVLNIYANETKSSNKETVSKSKKNHKKAEKISKSYTVKRGDNLQTISKKTGISVSKLKKHNKNLNNKDLKAGQKIKIRE